MRTPVEGPATIARPGLLTEAPTGRVGHWLLEPASAPTSPQSSLFLVFILIGTLKLHGFANDGDLFESFRSQRFKNDKFVFVTQRVAADEKFILPPKKIRHFLCGTLWPFFLQVSFLHSLRPSKYLNKDGSELYRGCCLADFIAFIPWLVTRLMGNAADERAQPEFLETSLWPEKDK